MYFTATWCPPCKKIGPIFEKMAPDFPDITFIKVRTLYYF
jgi:thioredoxin 1